MTLAFKNAETFCFNINPVEDFYLKKKKKELKCLSDYPDYEFN